MARLASSPVALSRPPLHFQPPRFSNYFHRSLVIRFNTRRSSFPTVACQTDPDSPAASTSEKPIVPAQVEEIVEQAATSSSDVMLPDFPTKTINKQIAAVSTLAAVALFLSARLDFGMSLKDLSAAALPYEEALSNGKPTVVEFYADWCEVCRELAPDVYKVEQQFKDRVNFVMLNVDNTKREQELDEFGVEGIPHFAFLDKEGNEEGNVVGRLPRKYLLENVDALARGEASVPHSRIVGQYSSAEARKVSSTVKQDLFEQKRRELSRASSIEASGRLFYSGSTHSA